MACCIILQNAVYVVKYCPIYDVASLEARMHRTGNQGVEVIGILTIISSDSHEKFEPPFPVNLACPC